MKTNLEGLSREELLRELRELSAAQEGAEAAHARAQDRAALRHELSVHQIQLEMQNRELREKQAALEEAKSRYEALYDFAPVGYATLQPGGHIREINLTGAALLGEPRSSLLGRRIGAVASVLDKEAVRDHLLRCAAEASRGRGAFRVTTETTLQARGRPPVAVQIVSTPSWNRDETAEYRTVISDVSALKELERRLRFLAGAGEQLARSLDFQSTAETVVQLAVPHLADLAFVDVLDDEARPRRGAIAFADRASDAALRDRLRSLAGEPGTLQADVLARGQPALYADLRPNDPPGDDRVVRAARVRSMMIVPLSARGRPFGALSLAVLHSGRRYTPGDLLLAENLGQRAAVALENARLHEAARRAVQARESLLAAVSHDLRTPLSTIMTKAATLLRLPGTSADSPVHRAGAVIIRAGDRMGRLIKDLLDIASIEAGHLSIEWAAHPTAALVAEAIETLEAKAAAKQVALLADLPDGDPGDVLCDRERILEVLVNLLDNAVKFSPPGAPVRVGARAAGAEVRFSVADVGSGIEPEHVRHLFHRFWQAEKTARQGTGLGLSIAKGIVEAHGGRIWVETTAGAGSAFFFTLRLAREGAAAPRAARASAPSPVPPAAPAPDGERSRPIVLVVDDDTDAREALGETLEDEGYRVVKATHGGEALAYLRAAPEPVLAVLLDLNMPVMDGWSFLAERNRDPALHAVHVIVVSGTRDVEEKVAQAGARYLEKPVRTKKLLGVLEQAEPR